MIRKHTISLQLLLVFLGSIVLSHLALPLLTEKQNVTDKLQPFLANVAVTDPDEVVAVIVQKQGLAFDEAALLNTVGGQVTGHFPLINSFAAHLPAHALTALAASPNVRYVALDAPVTTMNEATLAAADDFTTVAYNGSNGGYAWVGPWQESGEADGPVLGDVAVTPFWGGALQGLRLQGAEKGIARQLNLSAAADAQLTISYRRKEFGATDFVRVELSNDGGQRWQEIARLSGTVTDAAIQTAAYDLSAYRSATTMIRFITAPALSAAAKFYLDYVAVEATPLPGQSLQAAKALYLPLIANETESSRQGLALRNKAERLADQGRASNDECTWHCIDLTKVASTFVKAIGADQLWNREPYLRGQGVTVAVVDSGIAVNPDLNDYLGASRVITRVNFVNGAVLPDDYYGHGTHIAGAVAGSGQASNGVYLGVAPEAQLIDVRVMNDHGHGNTSDVIRGLQWIYDHRHTYNIRVVNLSLNSRVPESYHHSALNAALEVLWFNNVVAVVSAGNGGKQQLYPPANDPFVITIGSADDKGTVAINDDTLSTFSAYGMTADGFLKPDLLAPGANIVSLLASDDSNLLAAFPKQKVIAPNNSLYFQMSGTSMAAAVAAGAVAVLLEDEPALTPDQVKYRLLATARPFQGPESCAAGAGYLDLAGAVQGTTTASANTGLTASQLLWDGISDATLWDSISWNSVSWNTVSWNTVSWNTVSWNTVSWNTVSWNNNGTAQPSGSSSCLSAISGLTLVNDTTGADVQPLYDGAVVNLDALGGANLNIRADLVGEVESVQFALAGSAVITQVQNEAPYLLIDRATHDSMYRAEDSSIAKSAPSSWAGNYLALSTGIYTLTITGYTDDNAIGIAGGKMNLSFVMAGATRCEVEPLVRPARSRMPITLRVQNDSNESVELLSIGATGQRTSYGILAPGETKWQTTFATHPWLLARPSDQSCLYLIPDAGDEPNVDYTGSGNSSVTSPVYIYDDVGTETPVPTGTPDSGQFMVTPTPTGSSTDWPPPMPTPPAPPANP
ncbi:MAG: hypothetical protein DYG89_52640 [Caldilinea sp. CFX5]|nr:hypothetical protein [Caldilinea sp. CFX5]